MSDTVPERFPASAGSAKVPEWSDRITARSGGAEAVVIRVPSHDEFGNWRAVNHIITLAEAARLAVELAEAIATVMPQNDKAERLAPGETP